jgi:FkbM family methyltransferase
MASFIPVIKKIANSAYAPIKARLKSSYRPKQYVKKYGKENGMKLYEKFHNGDEGALVQYEIPEYGSPLFLRIGTSDEPTFRQVFMNIRYEIDIPFNPKTIIDGGSNIGYASVFYATKYPQAEILAIEPDSSNFEMVKKNTASYSNIKSIQSAIWGKSTYLKITNPETEKWAFEVSEATKDEADAFEAFSIQDLIEKRGWESVDFLKLDIEGSEMSVFQSGYESWLPKVKLLIIELHERMQPGCTEIFENAIDKYNFKKSISGENLVYINQDA